MDKSFLKELTPIDSYAFIHKTKNEYLIDILESGYLLPCDITGNENYTCVNQDPNEPSKIFLSLVRPSDKIKYDIISESEPILIFDSKLYLDYGMKDLCYFTIGWNYGKIDSERTSFFNKLDSRYTKDEKLKLNLNYIDLSLGVEEDFKVNFNF